MISMIFVILAAISNAVMDRLMIKYINLNSIQRDRYFGWFSFDPLAKWKFRKWGVEKAYNIFFYKIGIRTTLLTDNCNDAWHFFKSLMVVFLAIACAKTWIEFIIFGIVWNLFFNLTYKTKHGKF